MNFDSESINKRRDEIYLVVGLVVVVVVIEFAKPKAEVESIHNLVG
jgi:hypothetical protein